MVPGRATVPELHLLRYRVPPMNLFDKRTAQVLLTFLLFASILAFLYFACKGLIVFLFALLFAYVLEPAVSRLQRVTGNKRWAAIVVVYLCLVALIVLAVFLLGPRVVSEGRKLAQVVPDLYDKISSGTIAWQVGAQHGWSYETKAKLQGYLASHQQQVVSVIQGLGSRIALIAANAGWLFLVPILAVFFLKDKSNLQGLVAGTFDELMSDPRKRKLLRDVLQDLDNMLSHFVRAQLLLVVISVAAYTVGLRLLHVPYAFALGAIGGLLEFVPMAGPLTAAVLVLGVSFSMNYAHLLAVTMFLGLWRICVDYVITPRVLGGKVDVAPLAVIFGVLVGGELAGVIGIYLATPALATIRILWRHWLAYVTAKNLLPEHVLVDEHRE